MKNNLYKLNKDDISRIIEMAWEDRTPFESIFIAYGLTESEVITFMRQKMRKGSFRLWRSRVSGRKTKHQKIRGFTISRAYCGTQYKPRS